MRAELDRFNQICENVNVILNPQTGKATSHMAPFTETSVADGTKDLKAKEENPEKAGGPFTVGGTVTNEMLASDKKPVKNGGTETYTEDVKEKEGGIAASKTGKGKAVMCKESKGRTFKLTEEQAIAWARSLDQDYVDNSNDTEIGSSAPYCDGGECNEETAEYVIDIEDGIGGESTGDAEEYMEPFEDEIEITESELHDFGKHPAYGKQPMTTPSVKGGKVFGRDWDDESVKGDEPFGKSKGNSAPYIDDIVNIITDSITSQILKKKI